MNIDVGRVTATLYKITFWIYFFVGILCLAFFFKLFRLYC